MNRNSTVDRSDVAGAAAIVGGLALLADLGFRAFSGLGGTYFVVAMAMALCLSGAPFGLWAVGAVAPRWRRVAATGTGIVFGGIALWLAAFAALLRDPARAFSQALTPGGSVLLALGMLVLGLAVVRSRRLAGWRAWTAVAVGAWFPLQLVAQLLFFLGGRDGRPGPNGMLLGLWGVLWAAVGCGVIAASRSATSRTERAVATDQAPPRRGERPCRPLNRSAAPPAPPPCTTRTGS